jgi:hypothetical protein
MLLIYILIYPLGLTQFKGKGGKVTIGLNFVIVPLLSRYSRLHRHYTGFFRESQLLERSMLAPKKEFLTRLATGCGLRLMECLRLRVKDESGDGGQKCAGAGVQGRGGIVDF